MTRFAIRPYHASDLYMLYRICLETGADGDDATGTIDDEILGHFFAAPYAVLEPDLCFILTANGAPCGYILGTHDSNEFAARADEEWFPRLREKYPLRTATDKSREASLVRAIHRGYRAPDLAKDYPAHLHVDILPHGQGQGMGSALVEKFLGALRARRVTGVHLGVSKANKRAVNFYPKLGFDVVSATEDGFIFAKVLMALD